MIPSPASRCRALGLHGVPRVGAGRRSGARQRQGGHARPAGHDCGSRGHFRRPHRRRRIVGRHPPAGGPANAHHRPGRTHAHPRADRLAPARDPRRPQLFDRGELDRFAVADRRAGAHLGGRKDDEAGRLADRGRRVERAAVRREAAPHAGRARGCRAGQPRLRAAGLRLGGDDRGRLRGPGHQERRRPAARGAPGAGRQRQAARDDCGQQPGHRGAVRSAAEADLRRAGGRHARILQGAEPAGADRRGRPRRQQPGAARLCGVARCLAAGRDDRPRALLAERPDARPGAAGVQGLDRTVTDGVRRRVAEVHRAGRAGHRGDEQQPVADRRRPRALRGDRPLGGRARPRADDALGARRHRRPAARHLRAREPRRAAGAAALVDCAPQRRLRGLAAAHARAGRGLDGAGRDVLRRRRLRAPERGGRGAPGAAGRHRRQARRRRSAPAPTRTASPPTTRSRRCSGSSTARR